jgi:branched-chain amino acid transport system substrate-binding protein
MRLVATLLAFGLLLAGAQAQTVKVALIEPFSGGGASTGEAALKHLQYLVDEINGKGGVNGKKLEILTFDNKLNPQEALVQAQKAVDQGVRIIIQAAGSSVAGALTDFVAKHNERNPGKELIYLNYGAVDPVLTNDKCQYWHFRFDAHADIKMAALTSFMKTRPAIKKVYLINQDYSFGQAVRASALAMTKQQRPDIQFVGDELHPLMKINDFAPYITKIKASGADSVITGNWGPDFALLLKAAADAGLQVDWYTYYADGAGAATAIRQTGLANRVFIIKEGVANIDNASSQKDEAAFRARNNLSIWFPRAFNMMRMLATAMNDAKSDDPRVFAAKLEGMKFSLFNGDEGFMRPDDHQFFQPMYLASLGPLKPGEKFDEENTGWGWTDIAKVDIKDTVLPTTCKMNKPS